MTSGAGSFSFRPPLNSPALIGFAQHVFLPLFFRRHMKVEAVDVDPEALDRLRALQGQRAVLCPNHPTWQDAAIMFHLSKLLRTNFNFVAARESFNMPFRGWLMQRLGCYSIVRGTADRDAFRMTRQLLAEGKRWLVLFPEGETYGQNDTVMPFRPGIAQLVFWGLEDLDKQGGLQPVYLVPVAINYLYSHDMRREIEGALVRLDERLGLPPVDNAGGLGRDEIYARLLRIGDAVVGVVEKTYGIRPAAGSSLNDRIQDFKETIVARVANDLGISLGEDQPLIDRIRKLIRAMDQILAEDATGSEYEQEAYRLRQESLRSHYGELRRVMRFVATYEGYVRETMTAERFLEVIRLLECEVFGEPNRYGPVRVLVRTGDPINVADHWPAYRENKREAIAEVIGKLETSVQSLLSELMQQRHRLPA